MKKLTLSKLIDAIKEELEDDPWGNESTDISYITVKKGRVKLSYGQGEDLISKTFKLTQVLEKLLMIQEQMKGSDPLTNIAEVKFDPVFRMEDFIINNKS